MNAALDRARETKRSIAERPRVVFECRRGVHGNVTVYVEPECHEQPQAWCCGLSMKRVKS